MEVALAATIASMVAGGAAAGVGAYGQMKAGQAQSGQLKYQAGIAQINKQIATQNADYSRAVGEVEAEKSGLRSRFQMGKIITAQAAKGIDINSGSPTAIRDSQKRIGEMDVGIIRSNAAHRAWGYEVEAVKSTEEGKMMRTAADNVEKGAKIAAIGSILGGVSSVSSKWMQASQLGITPSGGGQPLGRTYGTLDERAYG